MDMTIQAAIEKKCPEMAHDHHRDAEVIEKECPKCGGQIICVYDDLGAVDYYDNYAHICLNPDCDFCIHAESVSLSMGGRQDSPSESCHFCPRQIKMTS